MRNSGQMTIGKTRPRFELAVIMIILPHRRMIWLWNNFGTHFGMTCQIISFFIQSWHHLNKRFFRIKIPSQNRKPRKVRRLNRKLLLNVIRIVPLYSATVFLSCRSSKAAFSVLNFCEIILAACFTWTSESSSLIGSSGDNETFFGFASASSGFSVIEFHFKSNSSAKRP